MGDQPVPATAAAPTRRWFQDPIIPSLATGGLLFLSFFPVNWGWLGWFAVVPLLHLVATPPPARMYWSIWLGGMTFGLASLQWVRLASEPMLFCWIGLALLISFHCLLFTWLTRRLTLRARWPLAIAAPCVWTALEFGRAHIGIGFPWYYLGHTQHDFLAVIQIADIFGGYGVSFLVMLVNVAVFQIARSLLGAVKDQAAIPVTERAKHYLARARLLATSATFGTAIVFLAATLLYGYWRLQDSEFAPGPRLALLQGNMPQFIRNEPGEWKRMKQHYGDLARTAANQLPDLVIWSETSCYFDWLRIADHCPSQFIDEDWQHYHDQTGLELYEIIHHQIPTLLGLNSHILEADGKRRKFNSALLVDGDVVARTRYDKIYRIPFGEYIPWAETIPIMKWLSPYDDGQEYGITAGTEFTNFSIPGVASSNFAVLICYEDSVPHLAPAYMRGPTPPDFFVNISNDGWFKGSSEHEQHLVAARFRAVECRRALARAVNMGISAVIDGNGRLIAMPGPTWSQSKDVATVVTATIPLDKRSSLYVLWGDVLPWICWIIVAAGFVVARAKPKPS